MSNAFRSLVVKTFLRKYKPNLEVESAGKNPSIPISSLARNYLLSENTERFLKYEPGSISKKKLRKYDVIIVMEPEQKFMILKNVQ